MPENNLWSVLDTNAKTAQRAHEIPVKTDADGNILLTKTYKLDAEIPTPMEEDHAMFFLRDPAFRVFNAKGEHVKPLVQRDGGLGGFKLGEDEVIAQYDELSRDALYKRCKTLPGSDVITVKSKNEDMIGFLKARTKPAVGKSRGSEGAVGEMSAAELDNLLAA